MSASINDRDLNRNHSRVNRELGTFARLLGRISSKEPRRVLVLTGGGARGASQVGMLSELHNAGLRFDAVVGCSVGALNGARYAATADGIAIEELEELWLDLRSTDIFPISPLQLIRGAINLPHLVSGNRLREVIAKTLPVADIEQTLLPLAVVTTDIVSGRSCIWQEGLAVDVLAASAALPGVYPPVRLSDGADHIDGGISSAAPVGVAERVFAADEIWLLDTLGRPRTDAHRNAREVINTAFIHALRSNAHAEITNAQVRALHHLELPARLHALDATSFNHTEELINAGRHVARQYLATL